MFVNSTMSSGERIYTALNQTPITDWIPPKILSTILFFVHFIYKWCDAVDVTVFCLMLVVTTIKHPLQAVRCLSLTHLPRQLRYVRLLEPVVRLEDVREAPPVHVLHHDGDRAVVKEGLVVLDHVRVAGAMQGAQLRRHLQETCGVDKRNSN